MTTNERSNRGFSLLELMIVVVVVAILTAVALPAYRQYVLRSHRTDATAALQDIASREESYFFSNNAYAASMSSLGAASTTQSGYFQLSVASATSSDYTVQATAAGTQTQDTACTSFLLSHAGQMTSQGTGTATTCWGSK